MSDHHVRALAMMFACLGIAACDQQSEAPRPAEIQQSPSPAPVASDPGAMAWPAARSPLPDDPALERRFQQVLVGQPSVADTIFSAMAPKGTTPFAASSAWNSAMASNFSNNIFFINTYQNAMNH